MFDHFGMDVMLLLLAASLVLNAILRGWMINLGVEQTGLYPHLRLQRQICIVLATICIAVWTVGKLFNWF